MKIVIFASDIQVNFIPDIVSEKVNALEDILTFKPNPQCFIDDIVILQKFRYALKTQKK